MYTRDYRRLGRQVTYVTQYGTYITINFVPTSKSALSDAVLLGETFIGSSRTQRSTAAAFKIDAFGCGTNENRIQLTLTRLMWEC